MDNSTVSFYKIYEVIDKMIYSHGIDNTYKILCQAKNQLEKTNVDEDNKLNEKKNYAKIFVSKEYLVKVLNTIDRIVRDRFNYKKEAEQKKISRRFKSFILMYEFNLNGIDISHILNSSNSSISIDNKKMYKIIFGTINNLKEYRGYDQIEFKETFNKCVEEIKKIE